MLGKRKIDVANEAFALIEAQPIASLDTNTPNAKIFNTHYDTTLLAMLEMRNWTFANRVIRMEGKIDSNRPDFAFAYNLPNHTVSVRFVRSDNESRYAAPDEGPPTRGILKHPSEVNFYNADYRRGDIITSVRENDYIVSGGVLYTNVENPIVGYTFWNDSEIYASAVFFRALVYAMAYQMSANTGLSNTVRQELWTEHNRLLSVAMTVDSRANQNTNYRREKPGDFYKRLRY